MPGPLLTVIIPTLNGGELFRRCLAAIKEQSLARSLEIVVVDSGSTDGTPEAALAVGAKVHSIAPGEFHHARTRNLALKLAGADIVIYMVQDALPVGDRWAEAALSALRDTEHAAAFGLSEPHPEAGPYARFEVRYHAEHMGSQQRVMRLDDEIASLDALPYDEALALLRLDNVCAIYRKSALQKLPFPEVFFGEDMAWARAALERGWSLGYEPRIRVLHSHDRPADYRFRRSLVHAVAAGEIMGRVKFDLSFLGVADIEALRAGLRARAGALYSMTGAVGITESSLVRARQAAGSGGAVVSARLRIRSTIKRAFDHMPGLVLRAAFMQTYPRTIYARIAADMGLARGLSPEATEGQWRECVDSAVASAEGKLAGEVYASKRLRGKLDKELAGYIEPHLKGV